MDFTHTPAFRVFMAIGLWTFLILVVGHIGWIVKFSRETWKSNDTAWKKYARICAVIVTPIVGFYTVEAIRHYRIPRAERPRLQKRRLILPSIVLGLCVWATVPVAMVQDMGDQRLIAVMTTFLTILARYLALYLPHHMLARVANISHHGPITSLIHLLAMTLAALLFLTPVF